MELFIFQQNKAFLQIPVCASGQFCSVSYNKSFDAFLKTPHLSLILRLLKSQKITGITKFISDSYKRCRLQKKGCTSLQTEIPFLRKALGLLLNFSHLSY